jgi:hypothetical protein
MGRFEALRALMALASGIAKPMYPVDRVLPITVVFPLSFSKILYRKRLLIIFYPFPEQ